MSPCVDRSDERSLSPQRWGSGEGPPGPFPRLERWIVILEDLIRIPCTRVTFGLDVILGVIPVVGDFVGLLCGLPIVAVAVRKGLPFRVILVMLANLLVDAVFGSVPVLGNFFDLLWKAHSKNLELLERPAALKGVVREAGGKIAALVAIVLILGLALVFLLAGLIWLYLQLLSTAGIPSL